MTERPVAAIAEDTVAFVLAVAEDSHPEGFAAYLQASAPEDVAADVDGRVVTDVLLAPPNRDRGAFDVLGVDAMPRRAPIVGTVRTGDAADDPEAIDDRGALRLVAQEPYDEIRIEDADGEPLDLPVVRAHFDDAETELP